MALLPVLLLLAPSGFGPNNCLAPGKSGNDRLSVPNCRTTSAKVADRTTRPGAKAGHVVVPLPLPPTNGAIIEGRARSMVKPWLPPRRDDKQVQG
jgi:hypothetical protein